MKRGDDETGCGHLLHAGPDGLVPWRRQQSCGVRHEDIALKVGVRGAIKSYEKGENDWAGSLISIGESVTVWPQSPKSVSNHSQTLRAFGIRHSLFMHPLTLLSVNLISKNALTPWKELSYFLYTSFCADPLATGLNFFSPDSWDSEIGAWEVC